MSIWFQVPDLFTGERISNAKEVTRTLESAGHGRTSASRNTQPTQQKQGLAETMPPKGGNTPSLAEIDSAEEFCPSPPSSNRSTVSKFSS
jgi:hypothetical protein